MQQWKQLIADGNDYFYKQKWRQAESYYKEAAFHLDLLWETNTKNVELLMAWISVSHNLATLFEAQNNPDLSLKYLLIPHNRMLAISASNEQCDEMKLIASNALKITFMPVLMFSKRHPICPECEQSLKEFKQSLDREEYSIH